MKVYYPGPGHETYHPELGMLVPDKPFDLDARTARKYIDSGLLRKVKEKPKKAQLPRGSSPDHSRWEPKTDS